MDERLKIEEECQLYLEELDKDPITGPNCYDVDSLTLGAMFRIHPGFLYQVNEEAKKKVKENELYSIFREEIIKISKQKGYSGIVNIDNEKDLVKDFIPGDYEEQIKEINRQNNTLKQTGGLTYENYQKMADDIIKVWTNFLYGDSENSKKPHIR